MNRMEKEVRRSRREWIPKKEQIGVIIALVVAVLFLFWQLKGLVQTPTATIHSKHFEHTFKDFGSYARVALFVVLAYYVLLFVIRQRIWGNLSNVKKWLSALLRLARRLHTPLAIIAIAFIVLHAVAVFMYGFKLDFNNISGLLALLVLLPVPVSGLLRYQRLDRKWHLRSGLAFAVLFLIHAFL
ncbi:hypothetical protein ABE504_16275 [Paenibacillus oryzisoli]|uniref:hypothetical protein n=1 Tax=Paenibacillus oryzisoli TaxID=1850517 RepID=UPI003D279F08